MKYEISQETLDRTADCKYDHRCLNGGRKCMCPVESSFGGRYVFVKPEDPFWQCMYKIPFGTASFVCNCPVRNEIYRKYGE